MRRAGVILAVLAAAVLAASASPARASRYLRVGIYDDAQMLYGPTDKTFAYVKALHAQEVRITLYWGGPFGVAQKRPASPTDPADPAYDWSLYDRAVDYATQAGAQVLFSIYGTPAWANGGQGAERGSHQCDRPAQLRPAPPRSATAASIRSRTAASCRR